MTKKDTAQTAAAIIAFLCASFFPLMIKTQPTATSTALIAINKVLMNGKICMSYPPYSFLSFAVGNGSMVIFLSEN
ncbi:MAG TPA: hypothetical protein VFD80_08815, partial [Flavobacteriaceae bacterium]|nr:hypothetical protein [Flavobacteriaceae bacterium]